MWSVPLESLCEKAGAGAGGGAGGGSRGAWAVHALLAARARRGAAARAHAEHTRAAAAARALALRAAAINEVLYPSPLLRAATTPHDAVQYYTDRVVHFLADRKRTRNLYVIDATI